MDARLDLTETRTAAAELLALAEWRTRVADLYAEVRRLPAPAEAWQRWCEVRADLFGHHPQSPLPPQARGHGNLPVYYGYSRDFRIAADAVPVVPTSRVTLPTSRGETMEATLVARLSFVVAGAECELEAYWLDGYAGGLLVPFRDGTSGAETSGSGRYVLDTAKGADLGWSEGRIVLDFNLAYQPSCSYDESWNCPIPPRANWLTVRIPAGERRRSAAHEAGLEEGPPLQG